MEYNNTPTYGLTPTWIVGERGYSGDSSIRHWDVTE